MHVTSPQAGAPTLSPSPDTPLAPSELPQITEDPAVPQIENFLTERLGKAITPLSCSARLVPSLWPN